MEQKAVLRSFVKRIEFELGQVAIDYTIPVPAEKDMISALRTDLCGVVRLLFHLSNVSLSSLDISIFLAIPAMLLLSHDEKVHSSHSRD